MKKILALILFSTLFISCREDSADNSCNCRKVYYQYRVYTVIENGLPVLRTSYNPTGASEKSLDCTSTGYQKINSDSYFRIECK